MELTYYKSFKRTGTVNVSQSDDPDYIIFEHGDRREELINPYAGVDKGAFAKCNLRQKTMEILN